MNVRAERPALQLRPRRAAQDGFKKGTISRAEGGQLQAPVGPAGGTRLELISASEIVRSAVALLPRPSSDTMLRTLIPHT
jgi:hypothetical protein